MKKVFVFVLCLMLTCCNSFEDDHELKVTIRDYLKKTLHDPKSLEEIDWNIDRYYQFKAVDTLIPFTEDTPLEIDFKKTAKYENTDEVIKLVELTFRATNGFGALRKSELYAIYRPELKTIEVDSISYSKEFGNLGKSTLLISPKKMFLTNEYYLSNNGKGTYNGFIKKYPEFEIK